MLVLDNVRKRAWRSAPLVLAPDRLAHSRVEAPAPLPARDKHVPVDRVALL